MNNSGLDERLAAVRLIAMDVDGVLTDGRITWSCIDLSGQETLFESKSFSARDGLGMGLARAAGLELAWITGRRSAIVEKRAAELGGVHLFQGVRDKSAILGLLMDRLGLAPEQVLYIGDDLNDLPAFGAAGVRVAPSDGAEEVRLQADWVTAAAGGEGVAREVIEAALFAQECAESAAAAFLDALTRSRSEETACPPN